jgi:hypothetical protein
MSVVQVVWATVVVLEKYMTLENQVAILVSGTTALQNTVSGEVAKTRAELATFKTEVVEKAVSATNNALVVFDGISGKNIKQNNRAVINDFGGATFDNIFIGIGTAGTRSNTNCIVGFNTSLSKNTTGNFLTAFGCQALTNNTTGVSNVAVGVNSLLANTTGGANTAVGVGTLSDNVSGFHNTAIGNQALSASSANNLQNCVGLGYNAEVTGNAQIQLGNSGQTTYVFGTVQNRSDERDKADIRPTKFGLEFIKLLRPVDYRWDMRDSYRTPMPDPVDENASEEEKDAYNAKYKEYQEGNKLSNITHDGSKKKKRFHHGLIAQEVQELIKSQRIEDFGGFQDHTMAGGDSVLSIGYAELIAPLIKAVQELAQVNEELQGRIATLEARK